MLLAHDISFSHSDLTPQELDVNRDSLVSPLDALVVVNALNIARLENVEPPPDLDVTGDGQINALDVDAILAELTRLSRSGELTVAVPHPVGAFDTFLAPTDTWNRSDRSDATGNSQRPIWSSMAEMNDESAPDAPTAREHGTILPLRFTGGSFSEKDSPEHNKTFVGPVRAALQTTGVNNVLSHMSELDEFIADEEKVSHGIGSERSEAQTGSTPGRPEVSIYANDGFADETGPDTGEFRLTRYGGSGTTDDLTVYLTVGGTATEGSDYESLSRTVTIPAGESDVAFLVTPIDDSVAEEGYETVVVKIEPDQNGQNYNRAVLCDTVTIADNEHSSGGSGGSGGWADFSVAEVHARRTAPLNIEESFFRIKQSEHFDIGSTFGFELVCAQGDTSNIRWQLLKPVSGTTDVVLDSGTGTSFAYTFSSSDDQSSPYVRFYDDANQNGSWDTSEEVNLNSPTFLVQERKQYSIDVDISSEITDSLGSARVQSLLDGAENVLLRKDSYYDARAAADFVLGDLTTFTATVYGGARPDPVRDEQVEYEKHFDAEADIVFVDDIEATGVLGVADSDPRGWDRIIVEYTGHTDELRHVVIAHEIGHGVGLGHDDDYDLHVMNSYVSENDIELSLADADAYD